MTMTDCAVRFSACVVQFWPVNCMCQCIALQSSKLPNAGMQSAQFLGLFWAICNDFAFYFSVPVWALNGLGLAKFTCT